MDSDLDLNLGLNLGPGLDLNLIYAKKVPRPEFIPPVIRKNLTNVARLGLSYENSVFKNLRKNHPELNIQHNPFYEYQFRGNRPCWCSPDLVIDLGNLVVIIEVKLTWVPDAANKLRNIYCPVVRRVLQKPAIGVVVCKNLVENAPREVSSISDALATGADCVVYWPDCHWSLPWEATGV